MYTRKLQQKICKVITHFVVFAMVFGVAFNTLPQPNITNDGALTFSSAVATAYAADTTITLTATTSTTWVVPNDWNSTSNTIEVIGGGGAGRSHCCNFGAGGGGGYSSENNVSLTPGSTVTIAIGDAGVAGAADTPTGGGDTYVCDSTSNCGAIASSSVVVGAKGGDAASGNVGGSGGAAGSGVGNVKYSGGAGGDSSQAGTDSGPGGGGAAGPLGNGGDGGDADTNASGQEASGGGGGNGGGTAGTNGGTDGGAGGNNQGGTGGGSGGSGGSGSAGTDGGGGGGADDVGAYTGGDGGDGTDLNGSIGGGGGGGGADDNAAGDGGLYGAGGGGGDPGGDGAQGVIYITYTPIASGTAAVWNATDWTLYDTITIDNAQVDDDLTDFPVYVDLADLSATFWSTTGSASSTVGADIRITTDSDTPTELPRELVAASSTLQTGELHFKANTISSTTDTVFRVYYNGTTTFDYLLTATYGAENVWTNGFDAVYHLSEDPGVAGSGEIIDSTSNARHGTDQGSMDSTDTVAGKTGNAISFDGASQYIDTNYNTDFSSGPFTLSAWFNTSVTTGDEVVLSKAAASSNRKEILVSAGTRTEFSVGDGAFQRSRNDTQTWADGNWHYLVGTTDSSTLTNFTDGVATTSDTHDDTLPTTTNNWHIGSFGDGGSGSGFFTGPIDEVRIASAVRSTAWISAEYTNQATTTDFYTTTEYAPPPLTISGTLYSDEGTTAITTGKTIKLAIGTSTPSVHTITSDGSGDFSFAVATSSLTATNTPITIWVDGDGSTKATLVSRLASSTANVTGLNLWQNHVIVSHEGSGLSKALTTADMDFYDGDDDTDIQFTASSTQAIALTVQSGNELYIAANKHFVPIGGVLIEGNAGTGNDGSFELADGAGFYGASTSLSVAGNFTIATTSTFYTPTEGIVFTATTTGKTITASLASTTYQNIGDVTFNGVGGSWTVSEQATTSDFTITAGSVSVASGKDLTVTGDYSNDGIFTNAGTLSMGPSVASGDDVSTGVYSSISNTSFPGDTGSVIFSPNGEKMYVGTYWTTNEVEEYILSTPWDISTASSTYTLSVPGAFDIVFSPDGTRLFELDEATGAVSSFELSTAWDLSTAVATNETYDDNIEGYGIDFSADGTKFYAAARNGTPQFVTYELAIPWVVTAESVVSSSTYDGVIAAEEADVEGIDFSPDGRYLYVIGRNGKSIDVFSLSIPWEVSASSITNINSAMSFSAEFVGATPRDVFVSPDGTNAYIVEGDSGGIYQYYISQPAQSLAGTLTGSSALGNVETRSDALTTFTASASTTDLTITNGTTTVSGALTLDLDGDYTNTSVFSASTSAVLFSGTTQQTATGTMTGTSAFYDLSLTNTSQNGTTSQSVVFGSGLTTGGTMTMVASTSAQFLAGATSTFQNIDWQGGSATEEVWLRSSSGGSQWILDVPGTQTTVQYVNVQDSDATPTSGGIVASNSTDVGNNTNWSFETVALVWNATDWTLYDTITIDSTQVDDDLTDFPVYIDLSDLSAQFWSTTPTGSTTVGTDIRITTNSGSPVELARELVVASSTAQSGELHFKANTISSTTDTVFRVYYNGDTNGDYATDATYGAQNVWSNGFEAVFHFNDDPGPGAAGDITDSTGNGNDGTADSSMTSSDLVSGKFGDTYEFDGSDDTIVLGGMSWTSAPLTVSAWANSNAASTTEQAILGDYEGGVGDGIFTVYKGNPAGGTRVGNNDGSFTSSDNTTQNWTETGWHHVAAVFDASNITNFTDGLASTSDSHDNTWPVSSANWYVGSINDTSAYFSGTIDEVRLASSTRSAAWMKAEYENQATTTDFYTVNLAGAWNVTDWTLYDTITIRHENIDEPLTDFPVYVDLADLSTQFWSTITEGGGDIRITTDEANPTELPREVVTASTTTETGELHFKADYLSEVIDTSYRIYYNGTTTADYAADATYGSQNVWDDYHIVWHMNEINQTDSAGNFETGVYNSDPALDSNGDIVLDVNDDMTAYTPNAGLSFTNWSSMVFWDESGNTVAGSNTEGDFNTFRVDTLNVTNASNTISVRSGNTSATEIEFALQETGRQILLVTYDDSTGLISTYNNGQFVATSTGVTPGGLWDNWKVYRIQGSLFESRGGTITKSAAFAKAQWSNFSTTTDFYTLTTGGTGSSTITNSDAGQVSNAFNFQNKTNEALFAFKLTPESGNATTTRVELEVRGYNYQKLNTTDFTNIRLLRDHDDDGAYDASDEQVGGAGAFSLWSKNNQYGTIVFTSDFLATTSQNFIVVADWNAPARGGHMTLDLKAEGIDMYDSNGSVEVTGSVSHVQHSRGGGGGGSSAIGGDAPVGDGDVGGGGEGGGGAIDTNTGGNTIGSSPDFYWPAANAGSWTTPANAYDQTDGTYATATSAVTNEFTDYSDSVPGSDTIQGIEVKLEVSGTTAAGDIGIELSWDGGSTFTSTGYDTGTLTTTDAVVTVGGASNLWGRTWSPSEFSNANFSVRLSGNPSSNTVQVDALQVKVYHQASGGGSGGGGGI